MKQVRRRCRWHIATCLTSHPSIRSPSTATSLFKWLAVIWSASQYDRFPFNRLDHYEAKEGPISRVRTTITDKRSDPALKGARPIHNILVVDDDKLILDSWKRATKGRNIITALDATTARQLATTARPELAIVDLRLRDTSGIDLIRELKHALPDLLAVLNSGYLSVASAMAAMQAGADFVVSKPITFREILQRVEGTDGEPDLEDTPTLARATWEHIIRVLADCNGNVSMAAKRLGIYRSSLQRRLRKVAPPG